ncbi:hypothetical protein ACP4OV_008059 [Aristida adscensionis]
MAGGQGQARPPQPDKSRAPGMAGGQGQARSTAQRPPFRSIFCIPTPTPTPTRAPPNPNPNPTPISTRIRSWRPWVRPPVNLPGYYVLEDSVPLAPPPVGLEQDWATVEFATRKAYGCGDHGQKMVDGLTLYVRLIRFPIPDIASALYLHANDDVLRGVWAEFGEDCGDGRPGTIDGYSRYGMGFIESVDENLLVLTLLFRFNGIKIYYYLVYNAVDSSLSMIRGPQDPLALITTTKMPLPVLRDGGCGGFELVIPTRWQVPPPPPVCEPMYDGYLEGTYDPFAFEDVLCVWSPEADSEKLASHRSVGPWKIQGRRFPPEFELPFMTDAQFSFGGKAFFVDLDQGIAYADLPAADDNSDVTFDFIPLPEEIQPQQRWEQSKKSKLESTMGFINDRRTTSYVGGYIRFVCINPIDRSARQKFGDGKVTVWTLRDLEKKEWNKDREFFTADIWKAVGSSCFRHGDLPKTEPKCPVLMSDGTICFLLPALLLDKQDPSADSIFNLDVCSQKLRIHWWGKLRECSYEDPPIVGAEFFQIRSPVVLRGGIFM